MSPPVFKGGDGVSTVSSEFRWEVLNIWSEPTLSCKIFLRLDGKKKRTSSETEIQNQLLAEYTRGIPDFNYEVTRNFY